MISQRKKVEFSNPDKKPLGKLILKTSDEGGVVMHVPALNPRWAAPPRFSEYICLVGPGGKIKTGADLDEWRDKNEQFLSNIVPLKFLRQFEFWSTMVYQKAALASIISFLKNLTPFYLDPVKLITDERCIKLYRHILHEVVSIICRIITNKETDEEWIELDHMKELIYSNYLVSIPMLFDLIVGLGEGHNMKILKRIFSTLFTIEPRYKNDLTAALRHFEVCFNNAQKLAENEGKEDVNAKVDENLDTPYDDVVLYILDCGFTLSLLFEVYPEAREICCDIELGPKITHLYDGTIQFLYKNIDVINPTAKSLEWLNIARVQYLRAFRSLSYYHIEAVLSNPEDSVIPSEKYVALMTECLDDRLFVVDYHRAYPVDLDVEILKQACKDLDHFKADYVAKAYKDESDADSFTTIGNLQQLDEEEREMVAPLFMARTEPEGTDEVEIDPNQPSTSKAARQMQANTAKAASSSSKERDVDEEVSNVREVFPDLGDGFVRRVLSRYESSEEAISAILEQNLPPDLIHADQTEIYIPPDPQDYLYELTGIKRYNIYDGDKYDVMTNDNPDCIIKIGKGFPHLPQNANDLLDDKTSINETRDRYQEYTLTEEREEESKEYNDEYDDSYEAVLESEARVSKAKELKKTLTAVADTSEDDDDGDEDDNNDKDDDDEPETSDLRQNFDKQLNFCENPEVIRARYEAKRAAKQGHRPPPQQPGKSKDVVGAPKGQGQDKQVTTNRHKKEVHKSSRANHNRKAGASFKRNKGMFS